MAAFSLTPEPGFEFKSTALLLPIPQEKSTFITNWNKIRVIIRTITYELVIFIR